MREKYVFRLSRDVMDDLDKVVPPRQHGRSDFINDALFNFLEQGKKPLADRPHLRGRVKAYKQVCALVDTEHLERARNIYADLSISVVIQAAVASEMAARRDKIGGLQKVNTPAVESPDDNQDPHDYSCAAGFARSLATAID